MRRNRPDGGFGAEKGSMVFWYDHQLWIAERISSKTWWCIRGGLGPPKLMPNRKGAWFASRPWMAADGDGGSKGRGEQAHPKQYQGWNAHIFGRRPSEEAAEWPDFWLKRSHTYQAREVQEPEKINNKLGKRGAVEWER